MKKNIDSLYIHFPFCRHLCNYCDFYKKIPETLGEYSDFENLFDKMWERHDSLLDEFDYDLSSIETLYIGGGTPSLWGARGAAFLSEKFKEKNLKLSHEGEFTLEVNPGSWTNEGINSWQTFGINRFSLGIQALDAQYLKMLDRVHDVDEVYETLRFFQNEKLNFSVDFMLGLPSHESMPSRNIKKELDEIFSFNPSHVSLYILTTKKSYIHSELLPSEESIAKEYEAVADYFTKKKWHHYEVSNFSRDGFESKHNLNYWRCRSVAAIGPSAVGYLAEDNYRYKWKSQKPDFEKEILTLEQVEIEKIYMGLRISDGLVINDIKLSGFSKLAQKWCEDGLAVQKSERIKLNAQGYLLIDMLMDQIFSLK